MMKKLTLSAAAMAAVVFAAPLAMAQPLEPDSTAIGPTLDVVIPAPTVLSSAPTSLGSVDGMFDYSPTALNAAYYWATPLPGTGDPNPFFVLDLGNNVNVTGLFFRCERAANRYTSFDLYLSNTTTFGETPDYSVNYPSLAGSGTWRESTSAPGTPVGAYYTFPTPITTRYLRFEGTGFATADPRISSFKLIGTAEPPASPFPDGFPPVQAEWDAGLGFIDRQIVPPSVTAASPNVIGTGPEKLFDNAHTTGGFSWAYYAVASLSNTEVDRDAPGDYVDGLAYVDMEFEGALLSMAALYYRNWRSTSNHLRGVRIYTSSDGDFDMTGAPDYEFDNLAASIGHSWILSPPITDPHVRFVVSDDYVTVETGAGANARLSNLIFFGDQLLLPAEHDGGDVLFGDNLAVYTIYNNTDEELTIDSIDTTNFPTGFSLVAPGSFPAAVGERENYDVIIGTDTNAVGEFAFDFTVNYTYDSASDSQVVSSSGEVFDDSAPTLTTVTIASDNAVDSTVAGPGDVITVSLTASKNIVAPTVTIAGGTAAVTGSGDSYTASRTVTGAFESGAATFEISGIEDPVGNAGADVTETTDASTVTIDTDAPVTTLVADSDAVAGTEVGFTYSVADDSAVSGTLLLVKAPGGESFEAAEAVFDNDTITYTATASGLHEFVAVSDDIAGNQEAVDEESAVAVVVNTVENAALTLDVADGTDVTVTFPMADGINVTITFASVSPAGTVTVERLLGAANAGTLGLDPDLLAGQVIVITAGGGFDFTTATIVFDIDEALLESGLGSLADIDTVYVNRGGTLTPISGASVSVDAGAGTITVTGVSEFSEWYFGDSTSNVQEWMILND